MTDGTKDLVVLVADKHAKSAVDGLLSRPESLQIRRLSYDIYVHPNSDPGCYNECHEFLRPLQSQYEYALVVFDLEGSGGESDGREAVEREMKQRVERAGWAGRVEVIAIDPELEVWVWSDSPQVDRCLGWTGRLEGLRQWLVENAFLDPDDPKPERPKEAMEAALEEVRTPLSSSIFQDLAESVSVNRCTDNSFQALREVLWEWFGRERWT
jgi:hypothetical protein